MGPFPRTKTTLTLVANAPHLFATKDNVDLAGLFLHQELPKVCSAKVGYLHKNLLTVLALVAMVDGLAKLCLTLGVKVSAGIMNILILLAEEVVLLPNAAIPVLTELLLAKIVVVGLLKH